MPNLDTCCIIRTKLDCDYFKNSYSQVIFLNRTITLPKNSLKCAYEDQEGAGLPNPSGSIKHKEYSEAKQRWEFKVCRVVQGHG